jgi:hypothetical protein
MKDDLDNIKGFREAWEDDFSPVYCTLNSDKWSNGHAKYTRWIGNYTHGDAFFYIPKYPFRGEIAAYSFLNAYESWQYFKKIGKVSPLSTLTIVNANDKFSQFNPEAEQVIRKEIAKRNINVIENTELIEVQKDNQRILLRDANGSVSTKDFNNLYVIPRGRPQESAIKAGLTVSLPSRRTTPASWTWTPAASRPRSMRTSSASATSTAWASPDPTGPPSTSSTSSGTTSSAPSRDSRPTPPTTGSTRPFFTPEPINASSSLRTTKAHRLPTSSALTRTSLEAWLTATTPECPGKP